jgi:glycopeptide antibiotics resistance protein
MAKSSSGTKDWLILSVYVALIYLTIPYTPRARDFFISILGKNFDVAVNSTLLVALAAAVYLIFRNARRRVEIILCVSVFAVIAAYIFIIFRTPITPIEKIHLAEYGLLGYLALNALQDVNPINRRYMLSVAVVLVIGALDEVVQMFFPNRYFQVSDIILNMVSGMLGLSVARLLKTRHSL